MHNTHIPHHLTSFVPSQPDQIIGREGELQRTYDHLHAGKPLLLFNGVGGIGKTTVAREYMAVHQAAYAHHAWLTVQTDVMAAFLNDAVFLKNLQVTQEVQDFLASGGGEKAQEAAFACVLAQLKALGKVLIVLDNANDLSDLVHVHRWLARLPIHILVTSRVRPDDWDCLPINPLDLDEGVAVFRRYHPSVNATDDDLRTVVRHLFQHTLLIELVAKAAKANNLPIAALLTALEGDSFHAAAVNRRAISVSAHSEAAGFDLRRANVEDYIWAIFQNITQLPESAQAVLRAFALLPTATAFDEDFLIEHFKIFNLTEEILHILDVSLVERGWLEKEFPEDKVAYKLHPLLADVVVKHLDVTVDFAASYMNFIANNIYYDNKDPNDNLFSKKEFEPLAERLVALFFDENTEGVSELLDNLSQYYRNFGFYQKAVEYGERALFISQNTPNIDEETIAKRQNNLAIVYSDLGRYAEAADLLEKSLVTVEKNLGKDHLEVAIRQSNLATVYKNLGRYTEAAQFLETALANDKKNFSKDHPTLAISQSNLAIVYKNLGRYAEAAQLLETALASDKKNFGKDHPTLTISQSNLANVYRELGRYAEAVQLLETAMASDEKNFGKDHPTLAIRQSNLANVYKDLGHYTKAAQLLETAMASDEKNFGKDHPTLAISQNNLAIVYYETGRAAEAKVLWQQAYQIYLNSLGAEHPLTQRFKKYAEM